MDKLCPKEFQDIELAHKTGFFLATVYFHKVVQHDNLKKGWITKSIIRKWHKKQPQKTNVVNIQCFKVGSFGGIALKKGSRPA